MPDPDKALATQLTNIEKRTGRTLDELTGLIRNSGLARHGEIVAMLKADLGLGHGDANTLAHLARKGAAAAPQDPAAALDELYVGKKAALRPIHERLLAELRTFGPFDAAPKKTYVSYRRSRQFATIGPATQTRVEIGLNAEKLGATDRFEALPPGRMCAYRVRVGDVLEVEEELVACLRQAYDAAE